MVTFTVMLDIDHVALATEIGEELGSRGLGQLDDQGLRDEIHDHCHRYQLLLPWQQAQLFRLVHDELFG